MNAVSAVMEEDSVFPLMKLLSAVRAVELMGPRTMMDLVSWASN